MRSWLVFKALIATLSGTIAYSQEPTLKAGIALEFGPIGASVTSVTPDGPGEHLFNETQSGARLQPGDLIEAVDDQPVRSDEEWYNAIERSGDGVLRLSIRDVNSGNTANWSLQANPTGQTQFDIQYEAYRRGIRGTSIPYTPFVFVQKNQYVMFNLHSVLTPIYGAADSAAPNVEFERLIVGVAAVDVFSQDNPELTPFSGQTFATCRELLANASPRIQELPTEDKQRIQQEVNAECYNLLLADIDRWARARNLRHVQKATLPKQVAFQAVSSIPGATVQLLLTAEKVLRLKHHGLPVRPVDVNGMQYLAQSVTWQPLPQPPQKASAYGKYYYRFVYSEAGNTVVTPFNEQQIITITSEPEGGEIIFLKF